jgi:hypothetical protein
MRPELVLRFGMSTILGVVGLYFTVTRDWVVGLGLVVLSLLGLSTARVIWKRDREHSL